MRCAVILWECSRSLLLVLRPWRHRWWHERDSWSCILSCYSVLFPQSLGLFGYLRVSALLFFFFLFKHLLDAFLLLPLGSLPFFLLCFNQGFQSRCLSIYFPLASSVCWWYGLLLLLRSEVLLGRYLRRWNVLAWRWCWCEAARHDRTGLSSYDWAAVLSLRHVW